MPAIVPDYETAVRRLKWDITHPPVYSQGVSDQAVEHLREFVGNAQGMDPSAFLPPPHGDPDARRHLRWLCALIHESIPNRQLPATVMFIVSNPGLTIDMVADAIEGRGTTEKDGYTLRQVGVLLRRGVSYVQIERQLGVDRRIVSDVADWIGCKTARENELRDIAADLYEQGSTSETLAEFTGISLAKAKRIFTEVSEAMAEEVV